MRVRSLGTRLLVLAVALGAVLVSGASAESKARIVRLSNVEGTVQMDRGEGFEKAFLNLPVVEGSKLKTGDDGRAEVEFEDGSILHLATNSEIEFPRLVLGDDGQKISTVLLIKGRAYVNARPGKGDKLTLNFARESATLSEAAHIRVNLDEAEATLAVLNGNVQVEGPAGKVDVAKKQSATFDLANNDTYAVAKSFKEDATDDWDKQQGEYHDRYASNKTYNASSPYAYGMSDLNYYGSYMNVPGYGWGWQPYFVGAGWSPFQDGGWAYYPGQGYMWVSSYPWGWMPYRYGNWTFVPGYGWIWQPGYWNTWYPLPRVVNPPRRTVVPVPPVRKTTSVVMVGHGLATNPPAGVPRRLTINRDSAGLGVPRGSVRNLDRVSRESAKSDRPVTVNTTRPVSSMPSSQGGWRTGGSSGGMRTSPPTRSPSPPVRGSKH
jgi:uncharacterized protein DUF6600/FecR-like protein